jgi:hypothetical protein
MKPVLPITSPAGEIAGRPKSTFGRRHPYEGKDIRAELQAYDELVNR